eukprot:scaffold4112_cov175-Prasinococcus_capsulatus_cf.AAC.1
MRTHSRDFQVEGCPRNHFSVDVCPLPLPRGPGPERADHAAGSRADTRRRMPLHEGHSRTLSRETQRPQEDSHLPAQQRPPLGPQPPIIIHHQHL